MKPKVGIIAGSKSDSELLQKAVSTAEDLGLSTVSSYISAHRQPELLSKFIEENDSKVFCYIAIAGLAAHLPGVVASKTTKPVIGVPGGGAMDGLDSLLSIVQMPRGIPVATVAIKGAENAAILAAEIAAITDNQIKKNVELLRKEMKHSG